MFSSINEPLRHKEREDELVFFAPLAASRFKFLYNQKGDPLLVGSPFI